MECPEQIASYIQRVSKAVSEIFNQLLTCYSTLYKVLLSVEDSGKDIAETVNAQVAIVIQDLKFELRKLLSQVDRLVSSFEDMAEYVTGDGVISEVKGDLETGSTEELKCLVEDMCEYVETCKARINSFGTSAAQFEADVKARSKEIDKKEKKKSIRQRVGKTAAVASGVASVGVGAAGLGLIATGVLAPVGIAAIASLSITGGACVVAAGVGGGIARAFAIDAEITQKEKEIYVKASKEVVACYEKFNDMRGTVTVLEENLCEVKDYIHGSEIEDGQTKGLKYHAENPVYKSRQTNVLRHKAAIITSLQGLCRAMEAVKEEAKLYHTSKRQEMIV